MDLYEILKKLDINYEEITHEAVYTIDEVLNSDILSKISGEECKNLFLKDSKKNYYLVVLSYDKRANLKDLGNILNAKHLSFASEEELMNILKLERGSVTPLGIINDVESQVFLVLDKDLKNKKVLIHPNVNTKTMAIEFDDLMKLIKYQKNDYLII